MKFAKSAAEAIEIHSRVKKTKISRGRFASRVKKHFETDYSNGRGLKLLGLDGRETKNFIEFYVDDSGEFIYETMVAVKGDDGWEVFDNQEALGYSPFLLAPSKFEERAKIERDKHYENRRIEADDSARLNNV